MRILVQRVVSATVVVKRKVVGSIGPGLLLFVGFGRNDTEDMVPLAVSKICQMRIFSDAAGKLNLSIRDAGGEALIVSQFTLYADCSRGRRPDFTPAAAPETAKALYERFVQEFQSSGIPTQTGIFAADMQVELVNDGPVTFLLEFPNLPGS